MTHKRLERKKAMDGPEIGVRTAQPKWERERYGVARMLIRHAILSTADKRG